VPEDLHAHAHSNARPAAPLAPARPAAAGASWLFLASGRQRVASAALLVAVLWLMVWWALD
jgi:hypothetical protein